MTQEQTTGSQNINNVYIKDIFNFSNMYIAKHERQYKEDSET